MVYDSMPSTFAHIRHREINMSIPYELSGFILLIYKLYVSSNCQNPVCTQNVQANICRDPSHHIRLDHLVFTSTLGIFMRKQLKLEMI